MDGHPPQQFNLDFANLDSSYQFKHLSMPIDAAYSSSAYPIMSPMETAQQSLPGFINPHSPNQVNNASVLMDTTYSSAAYPVMPVMAPTQQLFPNFIDPDASNEVSNPAVPINPVYPSNAYPVMSPTPLPVPAPTTPKKRRRKAANGSKDKMTDTEKERERRKSLERNREAATKSRAKQKVEQTKLRERLKQIEAQQRALEIRIAELNATRQFLRHSLLEHCDCGHGPTDQYLMAEMSRISFQAREHTMQTHLQKRLQAQGQLQMQPTLLTPEQQLGPPMFNPSWLDIEENINPSTPSLKD